MNIHRWLRKHSLRLLSIRDTPQAIAGGVAIGFFFGFTPLFGLKTVLAILFAWLTGSNILAAVIAGTLHDLALPLMPALYIWEYKLGYWLLSSPHAWPPEGLLESLRHFHSPFRWHSWADLLFGHTGRCLVVGGIVCATPLALVSFWVSHSVVSRHQAHKRARLAQRRAELRSPSEDDQQD